MGNLTTYSLTDFIPFTPEVYLRLFQRVNASVWPAQLASIIVGFAAIWFIYRDRSRFCGLLLGAAWALSGYVFHLRLYANLNWAATYFGWGFILEGALLVGLGFSGRLGVGEHATNRSQRLGFGLAIAGIALFPLLAPLFGRHWSGAECFGIAPDPTVVATLGCLLASDRVTSPALLIPIVWCGISGATAWAIDTPSGFVTGIIGLIVLATVLFRLVPNPLTGQTQR